MILTRKTKERYKLKAGILQALANPIRLMIVDYLSDGEQCVCKIVEAVKAERTNVSKHLTVLSKTGILSSRKEGLQVIYKLNMPCALNFLSCSDKIIDDQIKHKMSLLR